MAENSVPTTTTNYCYWLLSAGLTVQLPNNGGAPSLTVGNFIDVNAIRGVTAIYKSGGGANTKVTLPDSIPTPYGVPVQLGAGMRVALGTASTTIATFTPGAIGQFVVNWYVACKAAATATVTVVYTDPDTGALTTITVVNAAAMTAGQVLSGSVTLNSAASDAITVAGTSSVASDIIATATIKQEQ